MTEKLQKVYDIGGHAGVLPTNPSKLFECIDHTLLTAKINANGLNSWSLYVLSSCLDNKKERTKVNSSKRNSGNFGCPTTIYTGPITL